MIQDKHLRNTAQRKLTLDAVLAMRSHPTADQVYAYVRTQDAHISRGTVYRNLNILSELNEIRRMSMPIGPDHYDHRVDNHYHFCCRGCGRVVDTGLPYNEELNRATPGIAGYQTEWHRLVLVGLCPDCISEQNKKT